MAVGDLAQAHSPPALQHRKDAQRAIHGLNHRVHLSPKSASCDDRSISVWSRSHSTLSNAIRDSRPPHGSRLRPRSQENAMDEPSLTQKLAAEALGTAFLVFIGVGSVPATIIVNGDAPFTMADLGMISFAFATVVVATDLRARTHLGQSHQPGRHPRARRHRQVPVVAGARVHRCAGRRRDRRCRRHHRRARAWPPATQAWVSRRIPVT